MVKKRKKKKRWKSILLSEPLEGTSPPDNLTFCCCSVAQLCPTLCDPMYWNQASLSFTISQRLLKLTSIKLMMPSHHLILCHLWPLDAKSWLIGKDADAGKDWRQKERGWQRKRWLETITKSMDMNLSKLQERKHQSKHSQKNYLTKGDSGGQRSLECCSLWVCKKLGMTLQLNNCPSLLVV